MTRNSYKLYVVALICCAFAVVAGCKKPAVCTISGNDQDSYTQTDTNGVVIGTPDPKDWTNDNSWNACENDLFNFADTFSYQGLTSTTVHINPAYPNPFKTTFNFVALDTGTCIVKLVIVDTNLNAIAHTTLYNIRAETLQPPGIDSNAYYRIYYRFYGNNKTVIYQGHGDLRTK
jgi:hypothetical protein